MIQFIREILCKAAIRVITQRLLKIQYEHGMFTLPPKETAYELTKKAWETDGQFIVTQTKKFPNATAFALYMLATTANGMRNSNKINFLEVMIAVGMLLKDVDANSAKFRFSEVDQKLINISIEYFCQSLPYVYDNDPKLVQVLNEITEEPIKRLKDCK